MSWNQQPSNWNQPQGQPGASPGWGTQPPPGQQQWSSTGPQPYGQSQQWGPTPTTGPQQPGPKPGPKPGQPGQQQWGPTPTTGPQQPGQHQWGPTPTTGPQQPGQQQWGPTPTTGPQQPGQQQWGPIPTTGPQQPGQQQWGPTPTTGPQQPGQQQWGPTPTTGPQQPGQQQWGPTPTTGPQQPGQQQWGPTPTTGPQQTPAGKQMKKAMKQALKLQGRRDRTDPNSHLNKWYYDYFRELSQQQLDQLRKIFDGLDLSKDGMVSADELVNVVWPGNKQFEKSTVKKLIDVFDSDYSGCISFYEFAALYRYIEYLAQIFFACDVNRTYDLDQNEFLVALRNAGFDYFDNDTLRAFVKRFGLMNYWKSLAGDPKKKPKKYSTFDELIADTKVSYEEFVSFCVQLHYLWSIFEKTDEDRDGLIRLNQSEFARVVTSFIQ